MGIASIAGSYSSSSHSQRARVSPSGSAAIRSKRCT